MREDVRAIVEAAKRGLISCGLSSRGGQEGETEFSLRCRVLRTADRDYEMFVSVSPYRSVVTLVSGALTGGADVTVDVTNPDDPAEWASAIRYCVVQTRSHYESMARLFARLEDRMSWRNE